MTGETDNWAPAAPAYLVRRGKMGFRKYFQGRRVLVTGHTGFKGGWLAQWLKLEGALVAGLSLPPEQNGQPSLFETARVADGMQSHLGDIRDFARVRQVVESFQPELVLHLAAQALVRRSYRDPLETIATNVLGTAHVLEAARQTSSVRALVCVTTDKCYENKEWVWGYRESDPLGGKDVYSASKAACEIIAQAYRQSLLPLDGNRLAMATARGGNVIGGGDWSEDRLIPDIVRTMNAGKTLVLRNPKAVRPWQHVLELINGYLTLGHLLLEDPARAEGAWNFGPERGNEVEVGTLARAFGALYSEKGLAIDIQPSALAEAGLLKLDIAKATSLLPWKPMLDFEQTIALTAGWYRDFHRGGDAAALVKAQIAGYADRLDV
jgi:CDP-glucose 4,6-dehydratase